MSKQTNLSKQTRRNWLIDAAVFLGGLIAALSGVYFLFLPSGGYQGGRNPMYGVTILFSRETWDVAHTWSGVLMIAAVAVHLAIHWQWVTMMVRRAVNSLRSGDAMLSRGGRRNLALNMLVAVSFLVTAVSGVYFLFAPSGGSGHGISASATFLFSPTTWDLLHTWAGVVFIAAVAAHLAIHWRWVTHVTRRMVQSLRPRPRWNEAPVEA
jgi:uncharacterized membrane protein (UPF0182 family)